MKPSYSRSSLEPVSATRLTESTLRIQYEDPLESMYYAAGVSYTVDAEVMKIVVDRCPVSGECRTMLQRDVKPGPPSGVSQEIPLLAARVVMVYVDGEEQIFP